MAVSGLVMQPSAVRAAQPPEPDAGQDAGPPPPVPPPEPVENTPAAPQPPAPGDEAAAAKLARAKELFRQGNELRKVGDCERALELFVKSQQLVPSVPNVLNAALCLAALGRHDEAHEHYERLLTEHRDELRDDERAAIGPAMARLRAQLGSVDVVANVDGRLIIDGRPRGELPLVAAVRVLPGSHDIRVFREGYDTYKKTVAVKVGQTVRVDAVLQPLTTVGRLRIDDPALVGAAILVDGAAVGTAPWEGMLAVGPHYVITRKGDLGSTPTPSRTT